jgi:mono/diheme cytochrome c family protein
MEEFLKGIRRPVLAVAVALLAAQTVQAQTVQAQPAQAEDNASLGAGRRLAATHCGQCHAIDRTDQSPNPRAPRFRDFGAGFPFEGLRQALAEHMIVGHPEMPIVVLNQAEIGDLVAYLRSIQGPVRPDRSKERGA